MLQLIVKIIGTLLIFSALIFIHVFLLKQAWEYRSPKKEKIIVTVIGSATLTVEIGLLIWRMWFY